MTMSDDLFKNYCPVCQHPYGYKDSERGCTMPVKPGTNTPIGRTGEAHTSCKCKGPALHQVWMIDNTELLTSEQGRVVRRAVPLTNPLSEDEAGELFDKLNAASVDLPFDLEMRQVL